MPKNKLTKNRGGRPTIITEPIIAKLVAALQVGMSVKTACEYAKISQDAYYDKLKIDPRFSEQIADARNFQSLLAGQVLTRALQNDNVRAAMWLLERKEKVEFGNSPEVDVTVNASMMLPEPPDWFNPDVVAEHEAAQKK